MTVFTSVTENESEIFGHRVLRSCYGKTTKLVLLLSPFLQHLLMKLVNSWTNQPFIHQSAVSASWHSFWRTHLFCCVPSPTSAGSMTNSATWEVVCLKKCQLKFAVNVLELLLKAENYIWMLNELFTLTQVSLCWQRSPSSTAAVGKHSPFICSSVRCNLLKWYSALSDWMLFSVLVCLYDKYEATSWSQLQTHSAVTISWQGPQ